MLPYFFVAVLVWSFSLLEFFAGRKRVFFLSCFSVFLFIVFRFETGYDWPNYADLYLALPEFGSYDLSKVMVSADQHNMEPVFAIFISWIKVLFGGNFQWVIFFQSVLLVGSLAFLISSLSNSRTSVFAVCFSWLVFSLYFSVLRQSVSVSLFWIGVAFYFKDKRWWSCWFFFASILFQYSAVAYLLVFLISLRQYTKKFMWMVFLASFSLSFFSEQLVGFLLAPLALLDFSFVGSKVSFYLYDRQASINIADKMYVYCLGVFLGPVVIWFSSRCDGFIKYCCLSGFWFLCVTFLFFDFQVFRYRLQYFCYPFLFVAFYEWLKFVKIELRALVFFGVVMVSFLYMFMFLNKENSKPFLPYQFWPYYYLYDVSSDGRYRVYMAKDQDI